MSAYAEVNINAVAAKSALLSALQVFPQLTVNGIERSAAETAMAVAFAGGRSFVASAGGAMVRELSRAGVKHTDISLGTRPKFMGRTQALRLIGLIRREKIGLIHAHTRAAAQVAHIAAMATGARLITTFHNPLGRTGALHRWHDRFMLKGEKIIASSKYMADQLQQIYQIPAEQIAIVPRGVDVRWFDPARVGGERMAGLQRAWRLSDDVSLVLMPARIARHKGHRLLIDAMAKLTKKEIVAVMVGEASPEDTYVEELMRYISARGLEGRVRLAGVCTDMPAAYMLADVVVSVGARPLSVARVIMEAQAMGRPVIGFSEGAAREAMAVNETGWLVPAGDADALAATIELAATLNGDARLAVATAARGLIYDEFSLIRSSERMLDVYASLYQDM